MPKKIRRVGKRNNRFESMKRCLNVNKINMCYRTRGSFIVSLYPYKITTFWAVRLIGLIRNSSPGTKELFWKAAASFFSKKKHYTVIL